jgi:hypothetical protein
MNTLLTKSPQSISPVVRQGRDGVAAGLSIDRVVVDGDFLALSGWVIGGQDLTFTVADGGGIPMFPSLTFFPRDDVAAGYHVAPESGQARRSHCRSNCPRRNKALRQNSHTF